MFSSLPYNSIFNKYEIGNHNFLLNTYVCCVFEHLEYLSSSTIHMQGPGPSPSGDESKEKAWQNKSDNEREGPGVLMEEGKGNTLNEFQAVTGLSFLLC